MVKKITRSPQETMALAAEFAKNHPNGGVFCLNGDLGSGKTVFTKGIAKHLGIAEREVKSPTYAFLRSYPVKDVFLHHFDFYRIEQSDELIGHDIEQYFSRKGAWIVIEWPSRVLKCLPASKIDINFEYIDEKTREITYPTNE